MSKPALNPALSGRIRIVIDHGEHEVDIEEDFRRLAIKTHPMSKRSGNGFGL